MLNYHVDTCNRAIKQLDKYDTGLLKEHWGWMVDWHQGGVEEKKNVVNMKYSH